MLSPNQAREGPPIRVQRTRAKRMFAASEPPSANTPSRDILFPLLISGRKPAEWGHSGQIVRTMRTGSSVHFGPFFVSLGPVSPKQPNHGHVGTDVGSLIIQRVGGPSKGVGFEKPALRRSEQGSNTSVRTHLVRISRATRRFPSGTSRRERIPLCVSGREPGLNQGAVAVTSELDPAGLPLKMRMEQLGDRFCGISDRTPESMAP